MDPGVLLCERPALLPRPPGALHQETMTIPADLDFRWTGPPDGLEFVVEGVWYARGMSQHGRERILPSAGAVLLIVLGPPLQMVSAADPKTVLRVEGAWIEGAHERPTLNEPPGETHAVGVVFTPGGVSQIMDGPATSITNEILPIDATTLRLRPGRVLVERVRTVVDPDEAMAELGTAVAEVTSGVPDTAWLRGIRRLAAGETESVAEVQESLGVSRRYFVEQVRERAGLTPKFLQRIARMRRLLDQIDARRPVRWSQEAVGAGYFDQAHAIRDFRAFTGLTPTEYVERRRRAWGDDVEQGEAANFVPEVIR